ncbi:MAG: Aspartate--tRNA ligase [Alphaproteobacteria bacterium ADurb.Bin438]|nr:MAG: Aspartate--tRNA ligase [Alphaproteobacteria bacterium ADurb.Bin438]
MGYRTHKCGELRASHKGETVKIAGWILSKRDHGNLLFIDLRDNFGVTQVVAHPQSPVFSILEKLRIESVISITGEVVLRAEGTTNPKLPTGEIEVVAKEIEVHSEAEVLPIQVAEGYDNPEDQRLKYRFLDLRRERLHNNILLRSKVIASLRKGMLNQGFTEFQTPILTASSPEGARDFLVPSRLHPGKFYALPQAPQQFKQLIMVAGFDRYFQIAPCFRDEDSRADRSPGEFYQLDLEMSFVTQDDVFNAIEPVLSGTFNEFIDKSKVDQPPYVRIPYRESMLKYGNDKPDLRNPLIICDVGEIFKGSNFAVFANAVEAGKIVRAIPAPSASSKPRSWFDKLGDYAKELGQAGLGYINFAEDGAKGPLAKNLDEARLNKIKEVVGLKTGDAVFFTCDEPEKAAKAAGYVRTRIGEDLGLIDKSLYKFCWITDFPMFEYNEEDKKIDFSHNPFSMPQGGLEALLNKDPLEINAYQYDIVCNGVELSSGAIRNHRPDIMFKAFEIAGYGKEVVEQKFGGMLNAFKYGAPPHGGCAPGVDRIVMLIAGEPNIREVIMFPMNQQAQDLMMNAPSDVTEKQLRELHIKINAPKK